MSTASSSSDLSRRDGGATGVESPSHALPRARPRTSTPPYNPGLHQLIEGKRQWDFPRDDDARKRGFLGWHARGYLPHYDAPHLTQFVTFRLHDALPVSRRAEWEALLKIEDDREQRLRLEQYLDRSHGECHLRTPAVARLAQDALRHFDGERYQLHAWVLMPNHVHVLFNQLETPLDEIVGSWKSFTAKAANQLLGRAGHFWDREYYDTFMRDGEQFAQTVRYIENNPTKARLVRAPADWLWSSAKTAAKFRAFTGPPPSRRLTTPANPSVPEAPASDDVRPEPPGRRHDGAGVGLACWLLLVALWFPSAARAAFSTSAESTLFEINTGARLSDASASASASADFVMNTRGGAAGSFNSAYLTIDTRGVGSLNVAARTSDGLGASLANVTITARQNGLIVATATTAPDGTATLANLFAGYYELRAEKSGYLRQVRGQLRVPEDVVGGITFQMPAPKAAPALTQSASPPVASVLIRPVTGAIGVLKIFQGDANGSFSDVGTLHPDRMTIVLTHGCASSADRDADSWPLVLARKLAAVPGLTAQANIVAWDWRDAALQFTPNCAACGAVNVVLSLGCTVPRQFTPEEGLELGQTLWNTLGGGYTQPVHFLGHSLGTLVNAAAVNYLHGDDPRHPVAQAWDWRRTHVTLFDHAQLLPELRLRWQPARWASPIPANAAFVDNYMTAVGVSLDRGVNVFLQQMAYSHGFPYEWYGQTIDAPGSSALGFRWSFEFAQLNRLASPFPVPGLFADGALFRQKLSTAEPLALVQMERPEGLLDSVALKLGELELGLGYGALAVFQHGVQAEEAVVDAVGNAALAGGRKIGDVASSVSATVLNNYGGSLNPLDDPIYGVGASTPATLNIPGYARETLAQPDYSLRLDFLTLPPPPGPLHARGAKANDAAANTPAYVWLPVHIPSNAVALVFNFTLNGDGAGDRVVAGINDSNLFSLATQFIATNTAMSSGLLPVDAWAGQEVELFLGVAGGTSTNAMLSVEGIRFLSLPLPQLVAQPAAGNPTLSWTEASPGFLLESSTNLTSAANWTVVTNVGGYPGQRVFTNQAPAERTFYRLRRP